MILLLLLLEALSIVINTFIILTTINVTTIRISTGDATVIITIISNTGSVVTQNTATDSFTITNVIINIAAICSTTSNIITIGKTTAIIIIITTVINSITAITITINIIAILTAINFISMGIVIDNTTKMIIVAIIMDTGNAVIRNTAVTSITANNIVTSAVDITNNNNYSLTLFTTGSIAIINRTINNIATTGTKLPTPPRSSEETISLLSKIQGRLRLALR